METRVSQSLIQSICDEENTSGEGLHHFPQYCPAIGWHVATVWTKTTEKLFNLFFVPVDKFGRPKGIGEKIGGDKWQPMTHSQACAAKSKFTPRAGFSIVLREV